MPTALILLIGLSAFYEFLNGSRGGGNFVSTLVSTRVMSARKALFLAGVAVFLGPFLFGVAVARTFGEDLVVPGSLSLEAILAALIGAILWNLFTWVGAIPSSSNHALVGGLLGSILISAGPDAIRAPGLINILASLFLSPFLGLLFGYLVARLVIFLVRSASPRVNLVFQKGQIFTSLILALSYGSNDVQKTMGLLVLGLITIGHLPSFQIPLWVIALIAGAAGLGIILGGQRMIHTLGGSFYRLRPVDGFSSQLAAAGVILGATLVGGPVSNSHVVTTSILGAGAAERINKIRWGAVVSILQAWFLTIPVSAALGAGLAWLLLR
jgi:PiT family inorganic phosphate transporter